MKTPLLSCLALTALLFGCAAQSAPQASPAAAQPAVHHLSRDPMIDAYVGSMRADLSQGKIQVINTVMNFSGEEAKTFWPIYEDYESELFNLGDQRIELIRRFGAAQRSGKMEASQASELGDGYFKFEEQRLELLKKYHGMISKELSPVRAAQFIQIEHRFGTIIDLAIAAELPLIQSATH
jgi:hypothetical protein